MYLATFLIFSKSFFFLYGYLILVAPKNINKIIINIILFNNKILLKKYY